MLCKCNDDGTANCGEHCSVQCEDGFELVNHDADDGVCCSCRPISTQFCEEPAGVFREVSSKITIYAAAFLINTRIYVISDSNSTPK